jgi:hypothetical protein
MDRGIKLGAWPLCALCEHSLGAHGPERRFCVNFVMRGGRATGWRAMHMAAITRNADRKETVAAATDFLATRPRRRRGGALRLDTALKPWHKRGDWLGPAKHRGGHRGWRAHLQALGLDPPQVRQTITSNPLISRGARRQLLPSIGLNSGELQTDGGRRGSRFTRFQGER